MTFNLKVLGLAIAAVLAISALWAASAQAADPELHCTSTTNTCTVTGTATEEHRFNFAGDNTVNCLASLAATLNSKTVSSVSGVTVTYSRCRSFAGVTINMEGCTYRLNLVAGSEVTANFDIVCPERRTIVFDFPAFPCTVTIPPQNGLADVWFSNEGVEPTDVRAIFSVSGIRSTQTGACPSGTRTFLASFNGENKLEGFNDPKPGEEGNEVGLHVKPL